ncbi:MAG: hypothetical protein PHD33_00810 [Atribacterota bacterium]|nr:hypothetical protein [Atribacterota bacterium]
MNNVNSKNQYDYCEIYPHQGEYKVEYGYQTYNGKMLYPPIKIGSRNFSTEKKALRYARKIVSKEDINIFC